MALRFATVIRKKFTVDGPPSAESVLDVMPVGDAALAQFPAEVDFLVSIKGRKIDQPRFNVLELAPDLLDALHRALESPCGGVFLRAEVGDAVPRRDHAAGQRDATVDLHELAIILLVVFLEMDERTKQALHFGQEFFGFQ